MKTKYFANLNIDATISLKTYSENHQEKFVDGKWTLIDDINGVPNHQFNISEIGIIKQCTEKELSEHFLGTIPKEKDICKMRVYGKDVSPQYYYVCGKEDELKKLVYKIQDNISEIKERMSDEINIMLNKEIEQLKEI